MSEQFPDPYAKHDAPTIGPAPVPVMEQAFWVELSCRPEDVLAVEPPAGLRLLDRTSPESCADSARLYLRSDRGLADKDLVVGLKGAGRLVIPLTVRTYREDIRAQVRDVPGLDPSARKRGRSYFTDGRIAAARSNLQRTNSTGDRSRGQESTRFDGMADEDLFRYLPSWNVPRSCYSNWPCPSCGDAIYRESAYYPWKRDSGPPYRLMCPRCEGLFPSNDFLSDDFSSGAYPDDGWGWDPGSGDRADLAGWIAHYAHNLWHRFGSDVVRLTERFLLSDDLRAAHALGVLLARMAYVYPGMNMRWQQVDTTYQRPGRLLLDGNWERNQVLVPVCRAYDAIFDFLDQDRALAEFLKDKDRAIASPADVKALIETYLIQLFGWDWMRRELSGGNMGAREEDLAQFAVCADMGPVSDRWVEELFTHAYNGGLDRGGFDDETLVNTVSREGVCWVSGLGYAYGYLESKSDMAEILSGVTSPEWQHRCNLYDEEAYPKLRAEFDTWTDFLVAGQFGPGYGDSGGPGGHTFSEGIPAHLRTAYARAYRRWPTDRLARAIHLAGRGKPNPFEADVWDAVEAHVGRLAPEAPQGSRVKDGVGFVFLESRPEAVALTQRAAAVIRYGYARGHHHQDNLSVELIAKGVSLTPDLGYPCWAHPMGDTTHVAHHVTGMIDRSPQYQGVIARGDLEAFGLAPGTSFAEVSARPAGFANRLYRRSVCLADAPGGNVYLVDLLQMAGGTRRTWCFHGPPCGGFESSVAFGSAPEAAFEVEGFGRQWSNNIVSPRSVPTNEDVWADWKHLDSDVHLKVHTAGAVGRTYTIADCAKPDIPPIRYLFAEDTAPDGSSSFVSVWEPYESETFVRSVERLDVQGSGETDPVVVRVELAGGQVDTFIYSGDRCTEIEFDGLRFKGRFGYWSEVDGSLRVAHLVDGRYLAREGNGIPDLPSAFEGQIEAVDYASRTIRFDCPLPDDLDPVGGLVYLDARGHRTAYHATEVLSDRRGVRLDLDATIFRSAILDQSGDCVTCELPPPVEASRSFPAGYYDGATLTGEDRKARYRVIRVEDDRVYLDRPVKRMDFPEANGSGRRPVLIYDMGPGDRVRIPRSAFVRVDDGQVLGGSRE